MGPCGFFYRAVELDVGASSRWTLMDVIIDSAPSSAAAEIVELGDAKPLVATDLKAVIKQGWLTKEGAFVKSWKLNWFELTAHQVTYYNVEDRDKRLERGYFMLGDVESIRYCPRKYEVVQCLAVATRTRTWYLRASKEDLSSWLVALTAAIKALRYTTTLTLVVKDVHLLTLVIRDPSLAIKAEKLAKKDKKHMEKIDKLSLLQLVQSEFLFTHERLAVTKLCQTGFSTPAEGGAVLLALCLGVDILSVLRFYESTDWIKEHKAVTHYSNSAPKKVTTVSTNADGQMVTTTTMTEGRGAVESTIWSSKNKKKQCAPESAAIIEDHPRWRG